MAITTKVLLHHWAKFTFDDKTRMRFYQKLAALISNGVKLSNVIDELHARANKKGETDGLAIILLDLKIGLARGEGLSISLQKWVTPLECMIIASGEQSGRLSEAFSLAAESLEGAKEMRAAIKNSIAYPAFLLVAVIAIVYFIGVFFIPEIASIADPKSFTGAAASLYTVSEFVRSIWFLVTIIAIVSIISLIIISLPKAFGKDQFRIKLDRIPPWSLYRLMMGASFLVSLSAMLKAGIPIQTSIMQIRRYATPYVQIRLNAILAGISQGKMLGDAMENTGYGFPDKTIIDDLVIYSKLPNFDVIVYNYGRQWMKEGIETVKHNAEIMKSAAFLMMGTVVGWLVMGVLAVQQQISSSIQQFG